jgi:hypothetical protein
MLNEQNIEALKNRLLSLGFPDGLERGLRAHICLQQEAFTLQYRRQREGDVLHVALHVQRGGETPGYSCPYYEAILRKGVKVPALLLQGVDTGALEARMQAVNWHQALPPPFPEEADSAPYPGSWQREEAIEGIITDLRTLEQTAEGAAIAHQLQWKFWADTPLESLIPEVSHQKSSWEVSQRFYFFDGEEGITLDEAFRFLSHRWREKRWNAQKKRAGHHPSLAPAEESNAEEASGKGRSKKRAGKGSKAKR